MAQLTQGAGVLAQALGSGGGSEPEERPYSAAPFRLDGIFDCQLCALKKDLDTIRIRSISNTDESTYVLIWQAISVFCTSGGGCRTRVVSPLGYLPRLR